MTLCPFSVDTDWINVGSGNYFDIFYQSICDLTIKFIKVFNNVCSLEFKSMCLTEMFLCEFRCSQNFLKYMLYIVLTEIATLNDMVGEL
jgi:hypothetical protein